MVGYVREVYPDQYAGAAIAEDGRRAWIAFKGDIHGQLYDTVQPIPVEIELIGGRGFSEVELNEILQPIYPDIFNHEDVVAANGGYDQETGLITIQGQPAETMVEPDQLLETLQPDQPVNTAIRIEVMFGDELGGGGDASSDGTSGSSPVVIAGVLVAMVIVLIAGRLIAHERGV